MVFTTNCEIRIIFPKSCSENFVERLQEGTLMQFGYFDDQAREYVITSPRTPLPWINYLGTGDFFSLISNTAGGYSF